MTTIRGLRVLKPVALAGVLVSACADQKVGKEAAPDAAVRQERKVEVVQHLVSTGEIAYVSRHGDRRYHIQVVRADGSRKVLTSGPREERDPQWSPDGNRIAFVGLVHAPGDDAPQQSDIYIMDRGGAGEFRLTRGPAMKQDPSWSPDGTRIAFAISDPIDRSAHISVARVDSRKVIALSTPPDGCADREPAWSPDGLSIAFSRKCGDAASRLYLMTIDGKRLSVLSEVGRTPEWSPDGSAIAYTGLGSDGPAVFVISPDGSLDRQVTRAVSGDPAWSPDGTEIVFARAALSALDLFIIKLDGSALRRLTTDGSSVAASWGVGSSP